MVVHLADGGPRSKYNARLLELVDEVILGNDYQGYDPDDAESLQWIQLALRLGVEWKFTTWSSYMMESFRYHLAKNGHQFNENGHRHSDENPHTIVSRSELKRLGKIQCYIKCSCGTTFMSDNVKVTDSRAAYQQVLDQFDAHAHNDPDDDSVNPEAHPNRL